MAVAGKLTIFYTQPVNASANVTIANVVVNINAVMGTESVVGIGFDYQSMVSTIMRQGYWNSAQFIPASQITLIQYSTP